jgi:hypothetical protein
VAQNKIPDASNAEHPDDLSTQRDSQKSVAQVLLRVNDYLSECAMEIKLVTEV